MKFTATVTIGRNIGADGFAEPMSDKLWNEFRNDVKETILALTSHQDLYTMDALTSAGQYKDITEESATYVFGIYLHALADLRPRLYKLARHYSQECIALVIGHTDLVGLDS